MYFSVTNRRLVAIWLSAILLFLSVAAAAHSVEHIDDGVTTHCTLCFHQHQFDQVLPQHDVKLGFISQPIEQTTSIQPIVTLTHSVTYLSRAPPLTL